MADFEKLLFEERGVKKLRVLDNGKPSKKGSVSGRGCDNCPLQKKWKKGVHPIMGEVKGKKLFIIAQSPGQTENAKKKELVGKSGQWFWKEMSRVGLAREDCDIQNTVRCLPVSWDDETDQMVMRDPSKEEIRCCSIHTERALGKSKAQVYLLLGQIAAKEVLGREYRKDRKVFWSTVLQAKVFCADHPSYFLRGTAPGYRLKAFRQMLEEVANALQTNGSQFAYLEQQDYLKITDLKAGRKAEKLIRKYASRGKRIIVDIEEGDLEKRNAQGEIVKTKRAMLCIGFSYKPGHSRVFILDHPVGAGDYWNPLIPDSAVREGLKEIVIGLLTDKSIKKGCHHGSSDDNAIFRLLEVLMKGYDYDTNYSEYLVYPGRKSYGLEEIAFTRYPEFAGYKMVRYPEAFLVDQIDFGKTKNPSPEQVVKLASKQGKMNLARLPLKKLVLYNGADCDLTKRLEVSTRRHVNMPLMKVYKDAAYTIARMEKNGPLMDFVQLDILDMIYPPRRDELLRKIKLATGKPDFNPNSPPQLLKFLYKKLELPIVNAEIVDDRPKPNTRKETMQILAQKHEFPQLVLDYRRVNKICTTYLKGFRVSAELHNGHLQTKWWLTGTRTGRMSSGGGGQKGVSEDGIINLQNVHGDPNLQNLIISSKAWRKVYKAWLKAHDIFYVIEKGDKSKEVTELGTLLAAGWKLKAVTARLRKAHEGWWKRFKHYHVFLMFDQAQVEVRVLAQLTGDKNLIADCQGGDIHSKVGHRMTGWAIELIKKDKKTRTLTKNVHFGIIFGLMAAGLYDFIKAKDSTIDERYGGEKQARKAIAKLLEEYFIQYSGVKDWHESQREFAREHNYVETLFGFKRPLDTRDRDELGDDEEDSLGGAYWGNVALNSPVQGTAHQLMIIALALMKRMRVTYEKLQQLVMEVHDSMVFRVRLDAMFESAKLGNELLTKAILKVVKEEFGIDWQVPLEVEPKAGFRLGTSVELQDEYKNYISMDAFLTNWGASCHKAEVNLQHELAKVARQ